MKYLIGIIILITTMNTQIIFDFNKNSDITGWKIVDENTLLEYSCADIQGFDDLRLKEQLGQKDWHATEWCRPDDGCIDPVTSDK